MYRSLLLVKGYPKHMTNGVRNRYVRGVGRDSQTAGLAKSGSQRHYAEVTDEVNYVSASSDDHIGSIPGSTTIRLDDDRCCHSTPWLGLYGAC